MMTMVAEMTVTMAIFRRRMTFIVCAMLIIAGLAQSQTPCMTQQCGADKYCKETLDRRAVCVACDPSCDGCSGEGPTLCTACTTGYRLLPAGCQKCPVGFYGTNCAGVCNCLPADCNNVDGACDSWKCKRGYTGLPYCRDECPPGTFGLDCAFSCHCPLGDVCNHVNGDCPSGQCAPNYSGAGCQRQIPRLANAPEVVSAQCNNITIRWGAFNEEDNIGQGPIYEYRVEVHLNRTDDGTSGPWLSVGVLRHVPDRLAYTISALASVLEPDRDYNFRVNTIGENSDKPMVDYTPGLVSEVVNNPCTPVTTPEPTQPPVSREVFETIGVTSINDATMRLTWTVLPAYSRLEYDVTITRRLLGNGNCDDIGGAEQTLGIYNITDIPLDFPAETWSRYSYTVSAQARSEDVSEVKVLTEISQAVAPTTTVPNLNVTGITANDAYVTWTSMPCAQRKGQDGFYDLELTPAGGDPQRYAILDVAISRREFSGLPAFTDHTVRIRFNNLRGSGPYVSKDFKTLEGVPTAVQIASTTSTSSTITVTFDPPQRTNGVLVSYTVTFSLTSDFNETESRTEQARAGLRSIIVSRLQPDTLYYVKMAASTNAGIGQYGSVMSRRTLQAPPPAEDIALQLASETVNCLTLRWDPPQNRADDIVSYRLEVRMASADQTTPPIRVNLPSSSSSYQQCSLSPSSLYIVTITALDAGQAVISSITDNFSTAHGTPPEPRPPTFERSSYTNVTVSIEPVVSQFVPVTAYRLQVLLLTNQNRNRVWSSVPGYITAELDPSVVPNTVEFVIGDGEVIGGYTNLPLQRNSEYRIYYVAVSTLNNETTISSSSLELPFPTVPFDPDLAPPLPLSLSARTTQCLNLTWVAPSALSALITNFDFTISRASEDTDTPIQRTVSATERTFQQCNLAPFTLYTVRISARIGQEVSATTTETFLTLHAGPPAPLRPVFVDSSYSTLTLDLEPAVLTSGPLTAYQLQVEEVSAPSGGTSGRRRRSVPDVNELQNINSENWLKRTGGLWDFVVNDKDGLFEDELQWQSEGQGHARSRRAAGVPGYVTAQLEQGDITPKTRFVVGDGKTYGGYLNLPLSRDRWYVVHYVVLSTSSNVTKMSYSSLTPQAQAIPYVAPTAPSERSNTGVLIGVIVGLILLLLLLLLLLLIYIWWRRRNRFNPYELHDDEVKLPPETADDYDPMKYWSSAGTLKEGRYIVAGRELVFGQDSPPPSQARKQSTGLPEAPVLLTFKDEFQALPHQSNRATDSVARRQGSNLNRFPHLLPYDHSLVQLRPDVTSRGAYINASFLPGYKRTPAYIAAQSPYNEETVLDFWRLIYQRSIKTVVMITNVVEDHIVKCTQYWPTQTKASFGDSFFLHLIEVIEYADYTIRTIGVKMKGDTDSKVVRLFEFTSWPDHGVPDDPIPFLEMRYKVRRYQHDEPTPILVHCGTGMARTGVFIAVDALIDQYASEGRVMVQDFVRRMRKDRPFMVRTLKQYVFIYEAIFEEFHAGDTLVDFDLKERYHNWTQKNTRTGRTYLRDQFKLLETFTRELRRDQCKTGQLEANVHKNRFLDVLPADKDRPILKSPGPGTQSTDYINAVYVDGYLRRNQFIVTQTPLHTTVLDFWRLVWDHDVRTIVMVENFKHEDDTRAEYWPPAASGGVMKQLEPFFLETTACYQQENITVRNLRLLSTQHPRDPARFVRQFQFKAWAEHALASQSKTMMLDLVDSVFDWQEEACGNERPVLVHCLDGSSHSGLFTSLAVICERMEEDGEVDIYRTVKHIKRRRGQFISDYDQFRFCYKAVWDFMNLRMPGGTFTDTLGQNKTDKVYGVASLNLSSYMDKLNDLDMAGTNDTNV